MFIGVSVVVGELNDKFKVGEDDAVFEEEVARGPVNVKGGVFEGKGVAEAGERE